jgi:hypothetical protein
MFRKLFVLIWMICLCSFAQSQIEHAKLIKPLIDPVKLATLKERGANQRVQKITAILQDHANQKIRGFTCGSSECWLTHSSGMSNTQHCSVDQVKDENRLRS